ncbi:MAG: WbqC family protein [Opitutae bacterium]|nr:WbqC family protein [Opitutae bacterium]
MKLSIHQPDFWPWAGLFNKIACSDKFVVFDCVQAPRGKSWLTRNRILLNGNPLWLTLPILRSANQKINEVKINREVNYKTKHLGTIKQAYARAEYFKEIFAFVENLYAEDYENASSFSLQIIKAICVKLKIDTEFIGVSEIISDDELSRLSGNSLILEICKKGGANDYLSGMGCLDFIQPDKFKEEGISFKFQKLLHLEYRQQIATVFQPNMSVLDILFNLGFEQSADIIGRGFFFDEVV